MHPQEVPPPNPRRRFLTVTLLVLAMAGTSIAVFLLLRRSPETPESLLARLPTEDATVLSVNVSALRQGGLLRFFAANQMSEEAEYRSFVESSGFDYQRDLDSVLISFAPSGTFILAKGRFEWHKLEQYAAANHGSCYHQLCHMPGSTPERRISFLPLREDLIGLAVSSDDLAASRLERKEAQQPLTTVPSQPVWLSAPQSALQRSAKLGSGTRMFAQALMGAEHVLLTLGPHKDSEYEVRLEANCKNAGEAHVLSGQLQKLTDLLKSLIARNKQDDLAGLLASGSFSESGTKVFGYWPISKHLLQTLGSGS